MMGPQSRVPIEGPSGEPWSPQVPGAGPLEARPEEPWTVPDRQPMPLWVTFLFLVLTVVGAIILGSLLGWF